MKARWNSTKSRYYIWQLLLRCVFVTQLRDFSIQLLHMKLRFTACGFFPLDYTQLHAVRSHRTCFGGGIFVTRIFNICRWSRRSPRIWSSCSKRRIQRMPANGIIWWPKPWLRWATWLDAGPVDAANPVISTFLLDKRWNHLLKSGSFARARVVFDDFRTVFSGFRIVSANFWIVFADFRFVCADFWIVFADFRTVLPIFVLFLPIFVLFLSIFGLFSLIFGLFSPIF